jgi:beta-glucosidase
VATSSTGQQVALTFPKGFFWGAATAAHQVEGGNSNNDWWRWETNAGRIKNGDRSGLACDHFNRFQEDFQLLADIGHNAHRLSLEWSRLEPRPGEFDSEAIAHYARVLETLRKHDIEPFLTLHHFTNPLWLADAGGWLNPATIEVFERFVGRMVAEYRDLVRYWITINEPTVYAYHSYAQGIWPPGGRRLQAALRVLRHFVLAHGRAYRRIKEVDPDAQVGLAHHRTLLDPARPGHRRDRLIARLRQWLMDELYPAAIVRGRLPPPLGSGRPEPTLTGRCEDFVGVNYYTRGRTQFDPRQARVLFAREVFPDVARNTLGWELYPEGLYRVLMRTAGLATSIRVGEVARPIIITENGVADRDDELRPGYLVQHLEAAHRALRAGVPLAGYLHWSSMDNFEWAQGFEPRFGLVAVNYETQERRPKPSAELYADIIRANALSAEMVRRYPLAMS